MYDRQSVQDWGEGCPVLIGDCIQIISPFLQLLEQLPAVILYPIPTHPECTL